MFFKNKKIIKNNDSSTPLISTLSNPSVMNPFFNSGGTNTAIHSYASTSNFYASGSTMTVEGIWEMERERKRKERKGKIEELFPELNSLSNNDKEIELETNIQKSFG
jgi:hypothetical protein